MNAKVILLCLTAVVATHANSSGAPKEACFDMVPQHHVDPQSSPPPYAISLSKNELRAGDKVDVTIHGLKRTDTIKGFMVQARVGGVADGRWLVENNSYGQTLDCSTGETNKTKNAITHRKIEGDGPNSLTFTWEAPLNLVEDVHFRATVALNSHEFWVGNGPLSQTLSVV